MKNEISERRFSVKKRAKSIMGQRGNLLRLVGASFIILAISEAALYLFQTVCYFLFGDMTSVLIMLELFLVFMIASPLVLSLARMSYRMCLSERTCLSDTFYFFEKKRLRDAYAVSVFVLGERVFQCGISMTFGGMLSSVFMKSEDKHFLTLTFIFAALIMPAVGGVFTRAFSLPTAFFMKGSVTDALAMTKGVLRGQIKELILFDYSFFPLLLLSVLSLGILFPLYLLPLYLVASQLLASYFVGCRISVNYRK